MIRESFTPKGNLLNRHVVCPHLFPDASAADWIESGGCLVEKEHLRVVNQGRREVQPTLSSLRSRCR